jgi:hypothetical protein
MLILLTATLGSGRALALPSFAVQTGQPCAACHVGAFGPQLKPYGRDFKLHGYVASDGKDKEHGLPFAMTTQMSFTKTNKPQPGLADQGFRPNDNFAIDELSLYYAGRITPEIGAFIEVSYDGVAQQGGLGAVDIRHAREGQLFGQDVLWGLTANNGPTVTDPWNSTPTWGFPYNRSPLAPSPMASTLVDGGLEGRVGGGGGYMLWNDLLYLEGDLYKGLNGNALKTVGQVPIDDGNRTTSFIPYGRIALIKDWEKHHVEVGAFALSGDVMPGGDQNFGVRNHTTDLALDATYQFILHPTKVTSDMISAHATFIHERSTMQASTAQSMTGAALNHSLDTFRADISYSWAATITPSIQYFRTTGSTDPIYWTTPNGSPNSDGVIYEIAYVPWGKPDSPYPNVNLRLAVQYIDYFHFDGSALNARDNNNFYFSLWTAVKF